MVKNLPAIQEPRVQSLVREDSLEKEMATHYSIFAWRILWTEEPGRLQSQLDMTERPHTHTHTHPIPVTSSSKVFKKTLENSHPGTSSSLPL